MVKNVSGGSKYKKMASKNFKISNQRNLRVSKEENEIYAIITKKLGGGHMLVLGIDGIEYMTHIGGKFRNERISLNDFILIGLREWQSSSNKKNMTDLLEVYNENEKNKLIKINNYNWNTLLKMDNSFVEKNEDDCFDFANETEINYKELLENEIYKKDKINLNLSNFTISENEINNYDENDWINDI